jgi:hypothetical protein
MKKQSVLTFIAALFCLVSNSSAMLTSHQASSYFYKQIYSKDSGSCKSIAGKNYILRQNTPLSSNNTMKHISKEKYLHKSKVIRMIGFVFLGAGITFLEAGSILYSRQAKANPGGFNFAGMDETVLGYMSLTASIPFLIIAYHFKRKSMKIALNNNQYMMPGSKSVAYKSQPSLSLKIIF